VWPGSPSSAFGLGVQQEEEEEEFEKEGRRMRLCERVTIQKSKKKLLLFAT